MMGFKLISFHLIFLLIGIPLLAKAQCSVDPVTGISSACGELSSLQGSPSFHQVMKLADEGLNVIEAYRKSKGRITELSDKSLTSFKAKEIIGEVDELLESHLLEDLRKKGAIYGLTPADAYRTHSFWDFIQRDQEQKGTKLSENNVKELKDIFLDRFIASELKSCIRTALSRSVNACEPGKNGIDEGSNAPSYQAMIKAKISRSDSVDDKILKGLNLIALNYYLFESYPKPSDLEQPLELIHYGDDYYLDSTRRGEDILKQRMGGGCGSAAQAFALIMRQSGIPASDVRIIPGVDESEYRKLCPTKGLPRNQVKDTAGNGHDLVSLKTEKGWVLIDPSRNPIRAPLVGSPHEVQLRKLNTELDRIAPRGSSRYDRISTTRKLAGQISAQLTLADYSVLPFESPDVIKAKINQGKKVKVPKTNLDYIPHHDNDLNIMDVIPVEDNCALTVQDRLNWIASGDPSGKNCRF
ncbi:MAG: transglutaminase domain-containing protein [Bacteriovoracaceae bacterium]